MKLFDDFFGTKKTLENSWEDQKVKEVATTHKGAPRGGAPWCLLGSRGPPLVVLCSIIFSFLPKKSSKSFIQFRELLFQHKKQHQGSSAENSASPG